MAEDLSDDRIVKALAHPARREILRIFDEGIASPKEIAGKVGLPLPNVSYHVKILRDLGLIELKRTTPRRGAVEHHYAARPRRSLSPRAAASLPSSARSSVARSAWRQLAETSASADTIVQVRELRLDAKGEHEAIEAIEALWARLDKVQEASDRRADKSADEAGVFVAGHVFGRGPVAKPRKTGARAR
ncbi:MAG TPA: winged helix-turn-helix domain-containing protein [Solirubrobacteraceae bacterium]|jgi:DNA-binding transcriptional ArsR family regulator|nr:winged helix-turn-helix domain-containing protein [Solirubrobacteraceae bacterium]